MTIDLAVLGTTTSITREKNIGTSMSRRTSVCPSTAQSEDLDELVPLLTQNKRKETNGLTKEERAFFERRHTFADYMLIFQYQFHYFLPIHVAVSKENSPARAESRLDDVENTMSTTSTWQDEIESLEFIGMFSPIDNGADDREMLLPSTSSVIKVNARQQDRDDIKKGLDKLAHYAGQLSHRHADFNPDYLIQKSTQTTFNVFFLIFIPMYIIQKRDQASISKMRTQMKELLRRMNEIEKKFGRIEGGAYTLDFRRPFSASQAFAVALASITQRLK
uniref:Tub domain-containing protein n=1 Tax=Heterorhabditis bacteriophora TaxID=37862 RepID=A0A1I7WVS3_HETBA